MSASGSDTPKNIDIVIIPLWSDHVYRHVFKRLTNIRDRTSKPFAICLPTLADDGNLAKRFDSVKKFLHEKRVLYFLSLRDAAQSKTLLCDYSQFLKSFYKK